MLDDGPAGAATSSIIHAAAAGVKCKGLGRWEGQIPRWSIEWHRVWRICFRGGKASWVFWGMFWQACRGLCRIVTGSWRDEGRRGVECSRGQRLALRYFLFCVTHYERVGSTTLRSYE